MGVLERINGSEVGSAPTAPEPDPHQQLRSRIRTNSPEVGDESMAPVVNQRLRTNGSGLTFQ